MVQQEAGERVPERKPVLPRGFFPPEDVAGGVQRRGERAGFAFSRDGGRSSRGQAC